MTLNSIKFTYKRKDNNTYQSLNRKKLRILNETGNEILKENEINNENTHLQLKHKKQNPNDISSYFSKKIPQPTKNESVEINKKTLVKGNKTIESYFQIKPNKEKEIKEMKNKDNEIKNRILFKDNDKTIFQKKNYEQLYIDFGQKEISPIICPDCGMPYNPSIQEDDVQHQNYHNIIIDGIEYNGYKTDKIIKKISSGIYISKVTMSEATINHKKKLSQILNLIETELGAVSLKEEYIDNYKFFLYIKNKKLIGCAIVRDVKEGYKIEMNQDINEISTIEKINKSLVSKVPTLCGISRIWVSKKERKKGIASQLLENIRKNFLFNMTLERSQIAFSQPTKLGTKLAYHFFNYTDDEDTVIMIPSKNYIIIYMDDNN